MGELEAMSKGEEVLTPEALGEWLVGQQREFFTALVAGLQADNEEIPPLELSSKELVEMSCNAYAIQVSIVALSYHQCLDDSRFLSGGEKGGADIGQFLARIQARAREVSEPCIKIDSPQFDPFPIAGCMLKIEDSLPNILLYYGSMFTGLTPYEGVRPEAVKFAKGLVDEMKTTNPLANAEALAYFYAFQEALTAGGRVPSPDIRKLDVRLASILLRTRGTWSRFVITFQQRLRAFAGKRKPRFE